jgi:hypothetical protein
MVDEIRSFVDSIATIVVLAIGVVYVILFRKF